MNKIVDEHLAFKFSYPTLAEDSLEAEILLEVVQGKVPIQAGWSVLEKDHEIMEWFKLIAEANDLDPKHPLVAEAYWHGSTLLNRNYCFNNIHLYIRNKFPERSKDIDVIPEGNKPDHNLHVRHYGIISRDSTPKERKDCLVTAYISDGVSLLSTDSTIIKGVKNPFRYHITGTSLVAVHRNTICNVISAETYERLKK